MRLLIIEPVTVEFPGESRAYKKGDIVTPRRCDRVTDAGIEVCWGHGGYSLIPAESYEEHR